jgi:hypothetical protein
MSAILFEFEDLKWFPNVIRESMTDYLRYLLEALEFYKPIVPLLLDVTEKTNSTQIIDLGSGGGGAVYQLSKELSLQDKKNIRIVLTDLYPNINAYRYLSDKSKGTITYSEKSVNAAKVNTELKGVRTIFSGFHHFDERTAKSILKDAVKNTAGICIFDGGNRNILMAAGAIFLHPVLFFFCTPFFRPFRWSRIIFTYLIPLIPLCTMWDGMVSIMRLYTPEKLMQLAEETSGDYHWSAGKKQCRFGLKVTYLTGYPLRK